MNRKKLLLVIFIATALGLATTSQADHQSTNSYEVRNLVSNGTPSAAHSDPNLINGWGVAFNPNGFVWVSDNGTGKSTLYDGDGNPQSLVVAIPSAGNGSAPGKPTGIVFSGSSDFAVTKGTTSGPSRFIFSSEDGVISGWAPNVDGTHALLAVDKSASKAIYKGLALAANGTGNFLYATDFHNNKIDVFDKSFKPATLSGSFADPSIPKGYAPFGIQNLNGNLYVTYAKQDADAEDDVKGIGFGFVNVFDANGKLLRRVASRGLLNAPWGIALAPADFGKFSNQLLIGNFGDGLINAFDAATGEYLGYLKQSDGRPVRISGLWGMAFGNGLSNQFTSTLFFAAGPNNESNGLYGSITAVAGSSHGHDDRDDDDRN